MDALGYDFSTNLKVTGSNPVPETNIKARFPTRKAGFLLTKPMSPFTTIYDEF